MEPLKTVDDVDIERFMGDWYVIANIPTAIEKGAHNAIESYRLDDDGSIATTFTFNKDGFGGPLKTYEPRGYVSDESNAIWGMQFIWPIKADYRIIYLDNEYSVTVIGRNKRDYVWIMAREPAIPETRIHGYRKPVGVGWLRLRRHSAGASKMVAALNKLTAAKRSAYAEVSLK